MIVGYIGLKEPFWIQLAVCAKDDTDLLQKVQTDFVHLIGGHGVF